MKDERNILNVFDKIKNEDLKIQIDQIRNTNDKVEQNLLKESLPAFTVSATFNGRRKKYNVKEYNSLIHLDYDNIENPEQLKDELSKLETTFCAFISPFIPVRTQQKFLRWSRELLLIGYGIKPKDKHGL